MLVNRNCFSYVCNINNWILPWPFYIPCLRNPSMLGLLSHIYQMPHLILIALEVNNNNCLVAFRRRAGAMPLI